MYFRGLRHNIVIDGRRGWKVELVGGLDVRGLLEKRHQLRQIKELGEARPGTVACTFRGKLYGRLRLPKGGGPAVKVRKPLALNGVVLEVAHHGVKLRHAVADGCAGGEHDALVISDLVDIPAFQQHIRGFLCVSGRESGHISHLGIEEQIFEAVRFVHIEPVHA